MPIYAEAIEISIHSTARVETTEQDGGSMLCRDFNPLHREGGDTAELSKYTKRQEFQSTPPRGWRQAQRVSEKHYTRHFNPLHREGGDWYLGFLKKNLQNFNPLHREGGDAGMRFVCGAGGHFNPLHREGGDHITSFVRRITLISIHSTARVETQYEKEQRQRTLISIHSTARVETRSRSWGSTV